MMETGGRRAPVPPPPPPPPMPQWAANEEQEAPGNGSARPASAAAAQEGGVVGVRRLPRGDEDVPPAPPAATQQNSQSAAASRGSEHDGGPFVWVGGQAPGGQGFFGSSISALPARCVDPHVRGRNEAQDSQTTTGAAREEAARSARVAAEPPAAAAPTWVVNVRAPERSSFAPSLLQVQVSPRTTPEALSDAIRHALQLDAGLPIPGLFDEDSGIYYFLGDVLSRSRDLQHQPTFCLHAPRPRSRGEGAKQTRIRLPDDAIGQVGEWIRTRPGAAATAAALLVVIGLPVVRFVVHQLVVLQRCAFSGTRELLVHALQATHERAIVLPLRDMYRNGPWMFGGWEGDRLERVCSRITFHGDEAFWSRNAGECERIYAAKEEAWLRVTRPLANLMALLAVGGLAVRVLRRPIPRRLSATERDALESYRAIQVLMRLLKKNS